MIKLFLINAQKQYETTFKVTFKNKQPQTNGILTLKMGGTIDRINTRCIGPYNKGFFYKKSISLPSRKNKNITYKIYKRFL